MLEIVSGAQGGWGQCCECVKASSVTKGIADQNTE